MRYSFKLKDNIMKKSFIPFMLSAAFLLNGCVTGHLWSEATSDDISISYQDIGSDKIHAFGQVKTTTAQLEAGSLIMMGERYWYVLNPDSSEDIQTVLNAKLSQRYQIFDHNNRKPLPALPAVLSEEKDPTFSSRFCLRYDIPEHLSATQAAQEQTELLREKFTPAAEMPQQYHRCFSAVGKTFSKPENFKVDYRFEQYVPVSLEMRRTEKKSKDMLDVLLTIVATPIALTTDAAIAVVAVPALLLSLPAEK